MLRWVSKAGPAHGRKRAGMRAWLRRSAALLAMLSLAVAQFAATAHACASTAPPGAAAPGIGVGVAYGGEETPRPCAGHAHRSTVPAANFCEVHCSAGATATPIPDLPPVVLSPLRLPVLALSAQRAISTCHPSPRSAAAPAPPINLQFCRILV